MLSVVTSWCFFQQKRWVWIWVSNRRKGCPVMREGRIALENKLRMMWSPSIDSGDPQSWKQFSFLSIVENTMKSVIEILDDKYFNALNRRKFLVSLIVVIYWSKWVVCSMNESAARCWLLLCVFCVVMKIIIFCLDLVCCCLLAACCCSDAWCMTGGV